MGEIKKSSKRDMDKFHEMELEKILSGTQSLYTTRVTIGSGAVTPGIAILAVAFTDVATGQKWLQAIIFFIAAGMTIIFIFLDSLIKSVIATHYLRSIELLERFSIDDEQALTSIFALSPNEKSHIRKLLPKSPIKRYKALRNFGLKFPSLAGFWFPSLSVIADIAIGFYVIICGAIQ
jgi:hypothetical protein